MYKAINHKIRAHQRDVPKQQKPLMQKVQEKPIRENEE